jgi:hypothetical protein
MSSLSQTELYKYDARRALFVSKMKSKDSFELNNGSRVVFDIDDDLIKKINGKKDLKATVLTVTKNKKVIATYKLSDLKKNKEFGGGGGSGAGADVTKLGESAQAVYAQARWTGSKTYNKDDIKKAYSQSDTDETLSNIELNLTEDWRNSSILGAEELFKNFKNKKYTFHRGSKWVDNLQNHWKKLNQAEKAFTNLNKWSPADIYMISPKGEKVDVTSSKNIIELNNIMLANIKSKDIIGVSLKIMKGSSHLSYYNVDNKKKIIKFENYTTGTQGFFGGKDVYIYFTVEGKIQFRTFPETFQGEIKGKNANQGKLSYGPIQSVLRKLKLPQLIDVKVLRSGLEKTDLKIYEIFYANYKKYSKDNKLSMKEFIKECNDKGVSWCFSKFLGCQLIDIITSNTSQDNFVTEAISYASSSSDLSGPFLKLE